MKNEFIFPSLKEQKEWKESLYHSLYILATERNELEPDKDDSLGGLLSKFYYWADEYNDGYFSEQDKADTDRYCGWLTQGFLREYDYDKFKAEYDILECVKKEIESYAQGKMMREDSEIELDAFYDEDFDRDVIWLMDYSESRGSAEYVKALCYANDMTEKEFDELCKEFNCAFVKDAYFAKSEEEIER